MAIGRRTIRWSVIGKWFVAGVIGWPLAIVTSAVLLLGWDAHAVVSRSMEPALRPGDLLLVDPTSSIGPDEIIVFDTGRGATAHRVVERVDGRLVTRGDANPEPDSDPVSDDQVLGRARLVVPLIGFLVLMPAPVVGAALAGAGGLGVMARWRTRWRPGPVVGLVALAIAAVALGASDVSAVFAATTSTSADLTNDVIDPVPSTTATAGCDLILLGPGVEVNWGSAPEPRADGYVVQRSTDGTAFSTLATVGAGVTSHIDSDVNGLTQYWYRIVTTAGPWTAAPGPVATATTGLCL